MEFELLRHKREGGFHVQMSMFSIDIPSAKSRALRSCTDNVRDTILVPLVFSVIPHVASFQVAMSHSSPTASQAEHTPSRGGRMGDPERTAKVDRSSND